ncbi:MAG: hypothetical protein ABIF10_02495 [Candidatus Woesearchaeota archaeon]
MESLETELYHLQEYMNVVRDLVNEQEPIIVACVDYAMKACKKSMWRSVPYSLNLSRMNEERNNNYNKFNKMLPLALQYLDAMIIPLDKARGSAVNYCYLLQATENVTRSTIDFGQYLQEQLAIPGSIKPSHFKFPEKLLDINKASNDVGRVEWFANTLIRDICSFRTFVDYLCSHKDLQQ